MSLAKKVLHMKHHKECENSGNGVSSWNDLTDKPFGDVFVEKEYIFERDNVTKLNGTNGYILVCDTFDGNGLVAGQKYSIYYTQSLKGDSIVWEEYASVNNEDFVAEIDENGNVYLGSSNLNGSYPFYFSSEICAVNYIWVNQFTYAQGVKLVGAFKETRQLDEKFIPSNIGTWASMPDKPFYEEGWVVEWDTNPTDTFVPIKGADDEGFYKVSEFIPTKEELVGVTFKAEMEGEHIDIVLSEGDIADFNDDCYGMVDMPFFVITTKATNTEIVGVSFSFPSAGVWFISSSGLTWAYYLGKSEIIKLDEKYLSDNVVVKEEEVEIGSWESDFSYFNDTDGYLRQNYPTKLASDIIKFVINDNQVIETTMVQGRYPTIGVLDVDGIFLEGNTTGTSYAINIDEAKFGNIYSIKLFVKKYSQFNINALPNELKWLVNYNYNNVITENDRTFVLNNSIIKSVRVASADAIKDSLRVTVDIYDTNILMLNTVKDVQFKIKQLSLSANSSVTDVQIYSYYTGELVTDEELPYGVMIVAQSWKSGEWLLLNPVPKSENYIINSSTEGSTKKFKITVDDSGTISATEVTE